MAQSREKGGKVVFIGNIPYGVSEEQICEIFGRVGQVVSFRLVYDKETGRPKGFGFLEYQDVDAAASAVRNLNDSEIMGRTLRVDYSNDNGGGGNKNNQEQDNRIPQTMQSNPYAGAPPNGVDNSALPTLPQGQELLPGISAPDAISRTLSAFPAPQLLDILSQMKSWVTSEPQKAQQVLSQAPQLSYAIFQALLLLGLVDTNIISSLIQPSQHAQTAQAPPRAQPPPAARPPPLSYGQPPVPGMQVPNPYQQPPLPPQLNPYGAPQAPPQAFPQANYAPTPPVQQPAYQPPPMQQPTPQNALPQAPDPNQQQLIQKVMAMTKAEIFALPEGPRNQLLDLRRSWGAPVQ